MKTTKRFAFTMLALGAIVLMSTAPARAANVPDGEQAGYTTSGSLQQALPDLASGDVCTVSLWVGKRSDGAGNWGRWFVQLTTGGWNIQNVHSGSLAAQTEDWVLYEKTFTVGSFPASQTINLRLRGQWGFESYDLVELACNGGGNLVQNSSFENPIIPDGTWTTFGNPPTPSWTNIGGGAGVFDPNLTQFEDSFNLCSNGSSTDCNVMGTTLIGSSAFIDQSPPSDWIQCAGFINTSGDDVADGFMDNCLNTSRLRIRVWNSSGVLEEDVYANIDFTVAWPFFNYLGPTFDVTRVVWTFWGVTTFFTSTNGGEACTVNGGAAPLGTVTLGSGQASTGIIAAGNSDDFEWRVNCGGQALPGRKIALYK